MLDVSCFVVGGVGFPEAEHDADPLEGEGPDGGLVFASGFSFLAIVGGRPAAPLAGVIGELVEGLLEEFGARVTARDVERLSAAARDGRDAAVALDFMGGLTVRAECRGRRSGAA